MGNIIYLDHHATTPLDSIVLEKMLPYFTEIFGNSSSIDHTYGLKAKRATDEARKNISKILKCKNPTEIIFTSGATEANNLALIGSYKKFNKKGNHIITSTIEHPAILDTLDYLKTIGAEITYLPVDEYGTINIEDLKTAITDKTILITIMYANNEIGTIQPITEIGAISKEKGIIFHTDAAQAVGHEVVEVYKQNIDLMSFSAHKFYGPKGVGGLFVRSFQPRLRLEPILYGGGHENGMRSGTLNVPGIIGMSEALSICKKRQKSEKSRLMKLTEKIYTSLKNNFPEIYRNGHPTNRLAHNLNLTIPRIEAKALIHQLKNKLAFSAGSACSTATVKPSHVLKAIGLSDLHTFQTIRLGFGMKNNPQQQIDIILSNTLRNLT